jgi:ArsR family transcriptional regulator, arsenate/arsenite/antimonite-responsive transcriptional repressor
MYFDNHRNKGNQLKESLFKAIADPQRRKLLKLLQGGPLTAGRIAEEFDISKSSLSYHFNILKDADLIRSERQGQEQLYSLNTSVFESAAALLLDLFQKPSPRKRHA